MDPPQVVPPDPVPLPVDTAADALAEALGSAAWFLSVAALVYIVGQVLLVPVAVRAVRARNRNNPTLVDATETYLGVLLLVVATLVGVVAAGYGTILSDSALVVAAATLVLGIAGQELIGSLVSGLFLVTDREFNVGDWIEWPEGEGRIERIGFRATRVRTNTNAVVTVPNTALTTGHIARPYGHGRVRATQAVLVAYDDDIAAARQSLLDVVTDVEGVLESPAPKTRVTELGDDAVTLTVDYWVGDPSVGRVADAQSTVRARVVRQLSAEGVTLGPPAGRELGGRVTVDREE